MKRMMSLILMTLLVGAVAFAAIDAGNANCPVSGDKVSGKDFVEYNGKSYGLCCAMCESKFKKNPEKYIEKMDKGEISHESMM